MESVYIALIGLVSAVISALIGAVTSCKLIEWRLKAIESKIDRYDKMVERVAILETKIQ